MTMTSIRLQPSLPGMTPAPQALPSMASANVESRGAVFTRREVVDFILDLVGYKAGAPLAGYRLLEPSMGAGDFLGPAVERLLASYALTSAAARADAMSDLEGRIMGFELHRETYAACRALVVGLLRRSRFDAGQADRLASAWLRCGDFLLADLEGSFTHVVGNPPYVRIESVPPALMAEYRRLYSTMFDRADLYIPFIERSLSLLGQGGLMGMICADRWTKNRYGGPLREMIAASFHLRAFVDMVDTPAFHSDVIAYPAIMVVSRDAPGPTRVAVRPEIEAGTLGRLAGAMVGSSAPSSEVIEIERVAHGGQPWMLGAADQLSLVRRLEAALPTLEQAGCKVGIGVATGADDAFIGRYEDLDVEPDRKLPLVMTRDIASGEVRWRGLGVINPFADGGGLVQLGQYPRLAAYLESRREAIVGRHVARKSPLNWFRTIDRIDPTLATRPKLLIPDIKGQAHVVLEHGMLYPHHNLYYLASDVWDLHALRTVMRSDVARLFVSLYSTRMRGGYLRFQAQYLRRIRLPLWAGVPAGIRSALVAAGGDQVAINRAAAALYGLSGPELDVLAGMGWVADAA